MVNILVTGVGSTTAISVIKALKQKTEPKIKIIGTDINQKTEIAGSYFCDRFYQVPLAISDEYISNLLKICLEENIKIVFPIHDLELEVIAEKIDLFKEKNIDVWVSDLKTIKTCNDKYKTHLFLKNNNFYSPQTWLIEDLETQQDQLNYPVVIKPRQGVSSVDIFQADNELELKVFLNKVKNPIIQEYITGEEYTIDIVTDKSYKLIAVVPRKRIMTKAGISYKGITVKNETLIAEIIKLTEKLKIRGPCNFQCRMKNNKPYFFDINPRFSGGLPLTIKSGVNSPYLLVEISLGKKLNHNKLLDFQADLYMTRYWEEIFI